MPRKIFRTIVPGHSDTQMVRSRSGPAGSQWENQMVGLGGMRVGQEGENRLPAAKQDGRDKADHQDEAADYHGPC